MTSNVTDPALYAQSLPADRQPVIKAMRAAILDNLPDGFSETMGYGMLTYVIPHSVYPAGYHVDPRQPLPFMALASQKNYISFYHMGVYAMPDLMNWFITEYGKLSKSKPDMGKSCIRFRNPASIPVDLIGRLAASVSSAEWIRVYEKNLPKSV